MSMPVHNLVVRHVATSSLTPRLTNPRTHTKKQIAKLARGMEQFGWTNPILIDADNQIVCGHGRWQAAQLLGLPEVPVITLDQMSEADKRAYVIADNVHAEKAGWSRRLLATELQGLVELGYEVELTGFETIEIDSILTVLDGSEEEADEEAPLPAPGPAVSRLGDLWSIGPHRILCGSALDASSYEALMAGELADLVFIDPPFNVQIAGHVSGKGRVQHREFAMASGEMTSAQFTGFLRQPFRHLRNVSRPGAIHYVVMDWRHMREVLDAADGVYAELKNLCVWAKPAAGMGSFYRSQHELVFVFKASPGTHINNFGLGEGGRHRSNLWTYAGVNGFRPGRMKDLEAHPTAKPVRMVADAIQDTSRRGGIVLDAFLGSGTTLLAAHRTGRRGYGIELDPLYVDLVVRRLCEETGLEARNAEGMAFRDVAGARGVLDA